MQKLPSGTVTFLFTDIEGSTKLWQDYPDAMRPALARHDVLLWEAMTQNDGFVFKTVGDAFYSAFATAPEAMRAALAAQVALAAEPWSAGTELRVRMALHTGSAEERDGDYYGPPLNRVARLLAAGHGDHRPGRPHGDAPVRAVQTADGGLSARGGARGDPHRQRPRAALRADL